VKTTNLEVHTALSDAETARLRMLITTVGGQLAGTAASEGLKGSWAEMMTLLAVGPAPEVRACPVCGNFGMRAATLCGHCWARLQPLPATGR
jgi:hypothetical protein